MKLSHNSSQNAAFKSGLGSAGSSEDRQRATTSSSRPSHGEPALGNLDLPARQRQTMSQQLRPASSNATHALRAMTAAAGTASPDNQAIATYDKTKARAFPHLRETCAQYHVKEKHPKNTEGLTQWNTGKKGVKTQRKQATLQRDRDRILAGDRPESLVNVIGHDNSEKRNTILILFSPQGNPPSFYGVHPPEADGKSSWFPMDPHDKNIPTEYRQGWNYRLGGDWGDEPQYDSDEE